MNLLRICTLLAMCATAYASPLDEAAAAYEAGDFKKAAIDYTAVLAAETPSAILYYNLALAQKYADEPGHAAISLRRALMLEPRFSEARTALADLERSQGIASVPTRNFPQNFPQNWQDLVMQHVPLFPALVTAFSLFWIALVVVIFSSRTAKKIGFGLLAVLCLAVFLAGILSEPRVAWRNDVVIIQATTLSKIPAEKADTIAKLAPATVLTIASESGSWFFGKLPDGRSGWVQREAVERISPK